MDSKIPLPNNLKNQCLHTLHDYGETIASLVSKNGKEERVQLALHRLIKVFELWDLPRCIQRDNNTEWMIRIQDFQTPDYITINLCLQSSEEFNRFIAFLRHLILNWSQDIKVQKLYEGDLSFIVTHPAPVRLYFFPKDDTNLEEQSRFSTSKSSCVVSVWKVVEHLARDFGLFALNEAEKISNDKKESESKDIASSHTRDPYAEFQNNELISTAEYLRRNLSSDELLQQLKKAYVSAVNTSKNLSSQIQGHSVTQQSQTSFAEVEHLRAENRNLKSKIATLCQEFEAQRTTLQLRIDELVDENNRIAAIISEKDAELQETFLELGRVSVDLTRVQNERKRNKLFNQTYKSHSASTQTADASQSSEATSPARNDETSDERDRVHEQESFSKAASLESILQSGVEGNIDNKYKLALLKLSEQLKRLAETKFQIDSSGDVHSIFLALDRKKVISTTELSRLKAFFESILRYDFVCLIESYLKGDYKELNNFNQSRSTHRGSSSQRLRHFPPPQFSSDLLSLRTAATGSSQDPAKQSRLSDLGVKSQEATTSNSMNADTASSRRSTQRSEARDRSDSPNHRPLLYKPPRPIQSDRDQGATTRGVLATNSGRRLENEVQASDSTVRADRTNTSRNTNSGSNGLKLSKFQRPNSSGSTSTESHGPEDDSQWLCRHYKRRCYVQFECCNKFWPCHRCHNKQSACGRRKLKSRDTKRIKCASCNCEQEFAHYCSDCNTKFARYFCALCKHLTGTDDNPYHCEKCGICRIHGDGSYHCDICGVCVYFQLRGNHICREGSAHDECCICLEDTFTGFQILPCSHKVHRKCAAQMSKSGITRCPICRESFAHKLERRPAPSKNPP
ncbi:uncharacterized protein LOC114517888 isoform X2 [Dendronephthya gigantea]|uniref:uncharacterized protein LOC114517888 isoform X2 n=1 Tax=Dendronephthya gigantea TaxID=151771 RepID=UPI00106C738B|nr:uncharacterized protein LOC114517888 isoform X2 [Dendronephthya gigantea]